MELKVFDSRILSEEKLGNGREIFTVPCPGWPISEHTINSYCYVSCFVSALFL